MPRVGYRKQTEVETGRLSQGTTKLLCYKAILEMRNLLKSSPYENIYTFDRSEHTCNLNECQ